MRRTPLRRHTPLRAKPKKTALPTTTALRHELWKIFSEYIRRKAADIEGLANCVTCGAQKHWKQIHAGHFVSQSAGMNTVFDEQNVHPQCFACNIWRRGNIASYALFMVRTYGPAILEDMDARRRVIRKISRPEYLEMIEAYRRKLDGLNTKEAA